MYAALYRLLKGGRFAKFIQLAILLATALALLFFVIFPLVENLVP